MMQSNQGSKRKTALITGATSGIGHQLSKLFAQNGYNLVLVARDEPKLEQRSDELKKAFGISTKVISKDLSVISSPEEIFVEVQRESIQIDILVNNAGFQEYGPFSETDLQNEIQMIQVHIASLTHLTKLFLPGMLKQGHGRILNLGSTGSFIPGGPLNAVYCATKAYVLSFSEAIAEELKNTKITVTALCPGATNTAFAQRAQIEDIRLFKFGVMDAKKVAEIGYHALMKGKRIVVPGIANKLTVFSLRYMPRRLLTTITGFIMGRNNNIPKSQP